MIKCDNYCVIKYISDRCCIDKDIVETVLQLEKEYIDIFEKAKKEEFRNLMHVVKEE